MSRNPRQDLARKRRLRRRNEAWDAQRKAAKPCAECQGPPGFHWPICSQDDYVPMGVDWSEECDHTWADIQHRVRECVECGLVQQDLDHF